MYDECVVQCVDGVLGLDKRHDKFDTEKFRTNIDFINRILKSMILENLKIVLGSLHCHVLGYLHCQSKMATCTAMAAL